MSGEVGRRAGRKQGRFQSKFSLVLIHSPRESFKTRAITFSDGEFGPLKNP